MEERLHRSTTPEELYLDRSHAIHDLIHILASLDVISTVEAVNAHSETFTMCDRFYDRESAAF